MSNTDSWWQKALKFFLPLPQEELKPVVTEDLLKKALKEAEVVLEKFDKPKVVEKSKKHVELRVVIKEMINQLLMLMKHGSVAKPLLKNLRLRKPK